MSTADIFNRRPRPLAAKADQSGAPLTSMSILDMEREVAALYVDMHTAMVFSYPELAYAPFVSTTSLNSFSDVQLPDDHNSPGPTLSIPWVCKDFCDGTHGPLTIRGIVYVPKMDFVFFRLRVTAETLFDSMTSETAESEPIVGLVPPPQRTAWARTAMDYLAASFSIDIKPLPPSSRRIMLTFDGKFEADRNSFGSTVTRKAYIQNMVICESPQPAVPT